MNLLKGCFTSILLVVFLIGCNSVSDVVPENKDILYLKEKGFTVDKELGVIETYTLNKTKLTEMPYMLMWGLQQKNVTPFLNQKVNLKAYVVTNSNLKEKLKLNNQESFEVVLMETNEENVGGYLIKTNQKSDKLTGNIYSLSGESLEEVVKQDLQQWEHEWLEKYR
ncbi:MAG: hypothetical protein IKE29_06480 [Paenibacillus sp.]|uniref:hypothetical protein n=1 Tax=Paenibacillus sp. TaxID=58172 RepID=UPI0025F24FEB|nr:hypothetical protein [Paenibacillus sp.]MBR2564251.1 hypothetical protein [Paenibacillus sp.]